MMTLVFSTTISTIADAMRQPLSLLAGSSHASTSSGYSRVPRSPEDFGSFDTVPAFVFFISFCAAERANMIVLLLFFLFVYFSIHFVNEYMLIYRKPKLSVDQFLLLLVIYFKHWLFLFL